MRKLFAFIVAGAALGWAAAASAGGHNDAGCGIGAMVFKDNTKGQQILAATTNQYLGQVYSITSGTFGCTPDAVAFRREQRRIFMAVNFRNLSRELAQGQGEYASSFASLMGCREEAVPQFLSVTKRDYDALFPETGATPEAVLQAVESRVSSDKELAGACTL